MSLRNVLATFVIVMSFQFSEGFAADVVTFTSTGRVKLLMTGNTLGLSGEINANGPGSEGSIHTFTSLSSDSIDDVPANPINPWGSFTTYDFSSNGSSGLLNVPSGAEVVYAELIWGGSFRYVDDVTNELDSTIQFLTPTSSSEVSPSPQTSRTLDFLSNLGVPVAYYIRSSEVTALVAQGGSGSYAVSGVPGTQHESNNSLNAAGWALIVVVSQSGFECQTAQLRIGGDWVDETVSSQHIFLGLGAKNTAPLVGRILLGAIEGDANSLGDNVAIQSPDESGFVPLTTTNNPENNFFASQINDISGQLDNSGTWGTANHDAQSGTNGVGARQGWDITGVELSSGNGLLMPAQEQVTVRAATSGDSFVIAFLALEIEADPVGCPLIFADSFESLE
jgi:hypothetical protein